MEEAVIEKARSVKLLILDVDGVMTDGAITYDDEGRETKSFNSKDGHGIKLFMGAGLQVALITARSSKIVSNRAAELGITLVYQGAVDKLSVFLKILKDLSLGAAETAYMGDDVIDLPVLKRAGLSVAPSDASADVIERVDYITERPGGRGAVREAVEVILKTQSKWEGAIKDYLE
jgi:3-deoxy-D-manno-octulosonate 8-phosphate phosphatase (KDO 8-P phosphatase)